MQTSEKDPLLHSIAVLLRKKQREGRGQRRSSLVNCAGTIEENDL